MQNNVNHLCKT